LEGRGGDDRLIGGIGSDQLSGGSGKEVFVLGDQRTERGSDWPADEITDFEIGHDTLELQGFFGLTTDNLLLEASSSLVAKTSAATFLFDGDEGRLWWDADGKTSSYSPILVATLTDLRSLSEADLLVVESIMPT
jgi:Ca2+-binding RTX toxin-like protein